ncbi:hypothetical protein [Streptomyces shenzhenensis]|uniref:hypothetical protein n=1 Tax=Streptomyces shenzhenensis TaxID=943815 RepID=UPI00369234A2
MGEVLGGAVRQVAGEGHRAGGVADEVRLVEDGEGAVRLDGGGARAMGAGRVRAGRRREQPGAVGRSLHAAPGDPVAVEAALEDGLRR